MGRFFILIYPLFWLGIGKNYPFVLLGHHGKDVGAIIWGGITAWVIFRVFKKFWNSAVMQLQGDRLMFFWVLLGSVFSMAYDVLQWIQFRKLGYPFPVILLLVDLVWLLVALFIRKEKIFRYLLGYAILFALIHRAFSVLLFPLVTERSNMFWVIMQALERFSSGLHVYAPFVGSDVQLPYLPGTWLSYFPAFWLGIDPRWVGLFYFAILGLCYWMIFNKRHQTFRAAADYAPYVSGVLWFSNPYLGFRHELYFDFFWLVIFLAGWASWRKKTILASVLAGVSAFTLQWGWILLPFYCIAAFRGRKFGGLFWGALLALGVFALGMAPFYINEHDDLMRSVFIHQGLIKTGYLGELCLGMAPLFYLLNLGGVMQALQVIMLIVLGSVALIRWKKVIPGWADDSGVSNEASTAGDLMVFIPLSLLLFVIFNPFLENYFYLAPMLLFCFV